MEEEDRAVQEVEEEVLQDPVDHQEEVTKAEVHQAHQIGHHSYDRIRNYEVDHP